MITTNESATYMIYRVGRLLRYEAAKFLSAQTPVITPEQWSVLLKINETGPCSIGLLVDADLNDYPNITRMIDGLSKNGLVQRTTNPEDKRGRLVSLTTEGEQYISNILPELLETKENFYTGFSRNDLAELTRMLSAIEKNICG